MRQGAGERPWNVFIKIPELIIYAEQKHNEVSLERDRRAPDGIRARSALAFSF